MQDPLTIRPLDGPLDATVRLPGSKSLTNRALLLAALADGPSRIRNALFSDDTRYMAGALRALGLEVTEDADALTVTVNGAGGRVPASTADLRVGNSGTSARFLTSYLALGAGTYRLDGTARMRRRPIGDLLRSLRELGADVRCPGEEGYPPVEVRASGLPGGSCRLAASASSQFLSALLMVAPYARQGVRVQVDGPLVSQPYVEMTLGVMAEWGVRASHQHWRAFDVEPGGRYRARVYDVEPDASAASYFMAAAAVTAGHVRIPGLGRASVQGDLAFADVLRRMGCSVRWERDAIEVIGPDRLVGVDVDMNAISDTVMTLAAIAPFAATATTIRNVAHVRHKETDRLAALAAELRRLGVTVDEREDGLRIDPGPLRPTAVSTYDDHRMAMSFAVAGLRAPGIAIRDPGCVAKTFPGFFDVLEGIRSGG
ncbi:MAG: 3-phosphoshikimate 1-carboxyvinyltransferase [Chthonomonadales bacterium]|nr:3-phosphoshikimate 1-carboxyvinyltransferase [Chthonomonadales bacterium]